MKRLLINKVRIIYITVFMIFLSSCLGGDFQKADEIYKNNIPVLSLIVKQMKNDSLYTRIDIKKSNITRKILTLNFNNETLLYIEKRDYNFKIVRFDTMVIGNNFEYIPEKYFDKINYNYSKKDKEDLLRILKFIYSNDIYSVTMKTPEYSYISLNIGFISSLQCNFIDKFESDITKHQKIYGNWYYIEH